MIHFMLYDLCGKSTVFPVLWFKIRIQIIHLNLLITYTWADSVQGKTSLFRLISLRSFS